MYKLYPVKKNCKSHSSNNQVGQSREQVKVQLNQEQGSVDNGWSPVMEIGIQGRGVGRRHVAPEKESRGVGRGKVTAE